jgi:GT2 family glycosyltransferase
MAHSLLIVVLHYSGLDDTFECLDSMARQVGAEFHTLVVDNGSASRPGAVKPAPRMAIDYPDVELLELAENQGWAGGNNAGIRLAIERGYDLVCLLNNDTVLPPEAVAGLLASAEALGPCILHPAIDSYGADDHVQWDPTIPQPPELGVSPGPGRAGVYEINSVNGSCLMVHVSVVKQIGLIDERFFLLCEDADFGRRAVAAGFHIYCDVSVRIQHKESRSFGGRRKPIKTYYGMRNMLLFHEKHGDFSRGPRALLRNLTWTAWGAADAAGARPRSWWQFLRWAFSDDAFARAIRMGARDYLRRRFGRANPRDEAILSASDQTS